jgi:hypothetical protein
VSDVTDDIQAENNHVDVAPSVDEDRATLLTVQPEQAGSTSLPSVSPPADTYVYALGRVEPRFPTLAVEKEFAQVVGRADDTASLTDRQTIHSLLSKRENRYLAHQLCWVLTIEGIETYILHPRDPVDTDLLLEALRPVPRSTDVDAVVGILGPIAPPEVCNALLIPIVIFDQLYSFDVDSLIKTIPPPKGRRTQQFDVVAEELFSRVVQVSDNAGATDQHRALNYLSVRYPAIYHTAAEQFAANASLTRVDVRTSRLTGPRTIVDVIFAYTNRGTDVTEEYFVRVDVTEEFPFLVTKLGPYFGR